MHSKLILLQYVYSLAAHLKIVPTFRHDQLRLLVSFFSLQIPKTFIIVKQKINKLFLTVYHKYAFNLPLYAKMIPYSYFRDFFLVNNAYFHGTQNSNFVGSLPSWWFALRLKAFITGLSLKGTLNGLPYAPHPRTNSLRIFYCYLFLFRCPINGSYSNNVS